jgi:hypothetical protein
MRETGQALTLSAASGGPLRRSLAREPSRSRLGDYRCLRLSH